MKNSISILITFSVFLAACHSAENSNPNKIPVDTVTSGTVEIDSSEFKHSVVNNPSLWTIESPDNSIREKLVKPKNDSLSLLAPQQLIDALNENVKEIQLDFDRISNDTIYVAIPQSGVLTNQSGDTGAYNYLATVVYNLTELAHVKFVNFKFTAGDHATPGTYSRNDFKNLR